MYRIALAIMIVAVSSLITAQALYAESITLSPYSIAAALQAADKIVGTADKWQLVNAEQKNFLSEIYRQDKTKLLLSSFSPEEMKTVASFEAETINKFLKDHGFQIQLKPFANPDDFGVAGVMNLLVRWQEPGERCQVYGADGKTYPGARLEGEGVRYYKLDSFSHPVVKLATRSVKDFVCLMMLDDAVKTSIEIEQKINLYYRSVSKKIEYDGVKFPMVTLDQQADISWLVGMHASGKDGRPAIISQALQQNKLRMNEEGALAESAAAICVARGLGSYLVINKPFLVWFERNGIWIFTAYVDYSDWKDPGRLKEGEEK